MAKKSNGRKKEKSSTLKSVVKLPFVHDRFARDVSRVVRRQFKDMCVCVCVCVLCLRLVRR